MNGGYTKVPLRREERWTGARMQQGMVQLDHECNLNLDAGARAAEAAAADTIGHAGVPVGSTAFQVSVTPAGPLDLTIEPGRMWVDGMLVLAPEQFGYRSQDEIDVPAGSGMAFVYLDVFLEHVQPAEDPEALLDPALSRIDTAARTRIGYRVRVAPTTATTCSEAVAALTLANQSTGRLTASRIGPSAPSDPCAPPGDPLGRLPDGLFRVEVLDPGDASTARFAWSYENGAPAVGLASGGIAGDTVTLLPSPAVSFANGDLVEVSWLARRADRKPHGELYTVGSAGGGAAGQVLTLDRAVAAPGGADGLALRRWDGEAVGAAAAVTASLRGDDLGVRFSAAAGDYQAGDWWGARLREEEGTGIEPRSNARPDGVRHAFAPLALVDLDARTVLEDCRPTFTPLTGITFGTGACTVSVRPGDDLQAAVDSLPETGGEVCFAAGRYPVRSPVVVRGRRRVVFSGAGPASVVPAVGREAAVVFESCREVELRHLRIEGGATGKPPGDEHLNGAATFVACTDVVVADCVLTCPASTGRRQTCLTVRSGETGPPDRIRVEGNRFEVGLLQTGVLVVDPGQVAIAANHVVLAPDGFRSLPRELLARFVRKLIEEALESRDDVLIPVPGAPGLALAEDFMRLTGVKTGPVSSPELRGFARRVGAGDLGDLSRPSRAIIERYIASLEVGLQGIVVGGSRIRSVQVRDNVVEGTVQGIHVGASSESDTPDSAEEVLLSRNVVHALVPPDYDRERHGIFVGNARSVHVIDTVATLTRTGRSPRLADTPVEGIRVFGVLGPFLVIRHTSLRGFQIGIRVAPLVTPNLRIWTVTETMAVGARAALMAPSSVGSNNNAP